MPPTELAESTPIHTPQACQGKGRKPQRCIVIPRISSWLRHAKPRGMAPELGARGRWDSVRNGRILHPCTKLRGTRSSGPRRPLRPRALYKGASLAKAGRAKHPKSIDAATPIQLLMCGFRAPHGIFAALEIARPEHRAGQFGKTGTGRGGHPATREGAASVRAILGRFSAPSRPPASICPPMLTQALEGTQRPRIRALAWDTSHRPSKSAR